MTEDVHAVNGVLSALFALVVVLSLWAAAVYAAAKFVEWRNPPVGNFLDVGGQRLHYVERGRGKKDAVFLHGNGTMLQDFTLSDVFDHVSRTQRALAFDRPGFGYSTRPRDRSWTSAAQADVIAAAMRRLNCGPALVVGHSWGTMVAIALARRHPDLVSSLVLLSGYYYPTMRFDVGIAAIGAAPVLGDLLRFTISPVVGLVTLPLALKAMFSPSPIPARFERTFPHWMMLRPWHLRASFEDGKLMRVEAEALQREYAALQLPVFIAAGHADRIVSAERQSARLAKEVPGATFEDVGETGHMIQHTAAGRLRSIVDRASGSQVEAP